MDLKWGSNYPRKRPHKLLSVYLLNQKTNPSPQPGGIMPKKIPLFS